MSLSWNIIVCGDFPNPVIVSVPDPSKWRVTELKQEISKQADSIPTTDITLYLGNTVIPEDKPLKECQGMRNGIALLASIKPFVINVYCPDNDATFVVEVPKREFDRWTIEMIQEVISFKRLHEINLCNRDLLVFAGNALTDGNMKISTIPGITNNCLMTYTILQSFAFSIPNIENPKVRGVGVVLPHGTNISFASTKCFYDRYVSSSVSHCSYWLGNCSWRITVQQLDGSKTKVNKPCDLSIRSLREAISKEISVPTHQQRLIFGDTVLEDWKKYREYERAKITDYPFISDGVTLYLVQLTGGIRVNISKSCDSRGGHTYLNIFNPSITTLKNVVQYI